MSSQNIFIDWLLFVTIHPVKLHILLYPVYYYVLFIVQLWGLDFSHLTCASLLCLQDWTALTRSMWRSAWLQVNAPKSRSSLLSTTSWKWNTPSRWWKVEGESNYLPLCLPLFPCSTYHFTSHSIHFLNLQWLLSCPVSHNRNRGLYLFIYFCIQIDSSQI